MLQMIPAKVRTDDHRPVDTLARQLALAKLRRLRQQGMSYREIAIQIALESLTPATPSEGVLRERFGLTQREAVIALLLAEGKSNADLAKALFISPHTARHHTEKVLLKLGVHSRAEVGAKVLHG
jgi:DNA-binding CsgD family transcriptional regulator